jgi:hypothetical protein
VSKRLPSKPLALDNSHKDPESNEAEVASCQLGDTLLYFARDDSHHKNIGIQPQKVFS